MVSKRKLNMQEESSMSWSQMMEEAAALSSSTRRSRNRYVGVRQRPSGRWVAEIKDTIQKIRMWLGTYDTAEQAARAYDEAACLLRGSNTRTNFSSTSSPPALPSKISKLLLNRLKERNHVTTNETPPLITNENTINNDSVVTTVDDRVDFGFVDELLLDVDKECYCSPFEVAEEIMRPLENENDVMWKYERTFSASLYAFNGVSECLKKLEEKKDEDEEGMMMMMGCCWTSDDDDLSAFGFDFV